MQQALFDSPFLPVPLAQPPAMAPYPSTTPAKDAVQRWWRLQGRARRAGRAVEPLLVTPRILARIGAASCPVTRAPLSSRTAQVVPLRDDADVALGHLATLSMAAASAIETHSWTQAWRQSERLIEQGGGSASGLDAAAWRRLAVLRSFVQPLTPAQAAALPLRVLPPVRVRVLSPVQGLQVALTLAMLSEQRARALSRLASHETDEGTRQALHLFVLTLLARCPTDLLTLPPTAQRHALEDLWADDLLGRRWQRLALRLTDPAAQRLLERAQQQAGTGRGWRTLDIESAVDGWALPLQSRHASEVLPIGDGAPRLARAVLAADGDRQRVDAGTAAAVCT